MRESSMLAVNRLLNIGISPRRRENRLIAHTVMALSPDKTILVMAEGLPGSGSASYAGTEAMPEERRSTFLRILEAHVDGAQEIVVPRRQLLTLITEMQSDRVRIKVAEGHPLVISGSVEDCSICAAIALIMED